MKAEKQPKTVVYKKSDASDEQQVERSIGVKKRTRSFLSVDQSYTNDEQVESNTGVKKRTRSFLSVDQSYTNDEQVESNTGVKKRTRRVLSVDQSYTNVEQVKQEVNNTSNLLSVDQVWNLKCAALEEYCRIHNKLPPQKGTVVEIGELGQVELGIWCHSQQKRYKHSKRRTPLNEEQSRKLKEIPRFCAWTEDAHKDREERWEINYHALVEYCQEHKALPPVKYITPDGKLNLGTWVAVRKQRYKQHKPSPLSDSESTKLLAVEPFRLWAKKPLSNDKKVPWETYYQGLLGYIEQYKKLPSINIKYDVQDHGQLRLGRWLDDQKKRFKCVGPCICMPLTDIERGQLLTVDLFRLWTEKPPSLVKHKGPIPLVSAAQYMLFPNRQPLPLSVEQIATTGAAVQLATSSSVTAASSSSSSSSSSSVATSPYKPLPSSSSSAATSPYKPLPSSSSSSSSSSSATSPYKPLPSSLPSSSSSSSKSSSKPFSSLLSLPPPPPPRSATKAKAMNMTMEKDPFSIAV